jgi:diaminopimelate decarboxylase
MSQKEIVQVVDKFDLLQFVSDCIDVIGIDDSFFITDVGNVVKKFLLWNQLFPRIQPDFAIKCNDLAVVASTLAALGNGF